MPSIITETKGADMNIISTAILIILCLTACDGNAELFCNSHCKANKRTCTEDQMDLVQREIDLCSQGADVTAYYPAHCYDIAKIAHCSIAKERT